MSSPLETKTPPEGLSAWLRSGKFDLRKITSRILYGGIFVLLVVAAPIYSIYLFRVNQKRVAALYLTRAKAMLRHDEFDAASESLKKAALTDSRNIQIQTELIKTEIFMVANQSDSLGRLLNLQQLDKAEKDCKALLAQDSENAELTALLGIVYAHKDQPILAMETYAKAAKMAPNYANVRNYWGASAYQWEYPENWRELAAQKFKEAKALDPNYVIPRVNLAKLELANPLNPNFEGADSILSDADKITSNNSSLYIFWGIVLDAWGRSLQDNRKVEAYQKFAEALEKYRVAEGLEPKSALIHFDKATALADLNRFDDALNELRKAVGLKRDFLQAHDAIARILLYRDTFHQSEFEEVIAHLNEAIRLSRQISAQYDERITKTSDLHAQKKLKLWSSAEATLIQNYEGLREQAKARLAGAGPVTETSPKKR